ncbi:hypothetical protein Kpol_2002p58 [Vanderwaltozyma polyspora DSM 70294]|uniref:MHD domain-containing protein n=1 Tax=Vanderwaltozyma polyspora (strain ATCC 22028 / DSM 70294 / BCRC 21397 / CBS 2163 / NBRC 10782 / NRRL Y-8283 / UCD 57-17) TaxID=436907 RepID=A7TFH3_VANPO|nr:uncharacterized protein Kpol_2002p58 [Vanderwaltozyma polyspora DSM 70294]EDO18987.1 hypothetical protein Kpol_2002p58 [Vanderwaltozyma polyspora DSM 70294]
MSTERTTYSSNLLTAKEPFESTEAIRIRLSQAKLINKNFYLLLKDIADLKQNYVQQLRKIVAQNDNLDQLLKKQMIENQVLTREELANFSFNSVGELNQLWDTLLGELKSDMNATTQFQLMLQHDIVSNLKNATESDGRWSESRKLHSRLTQVASKIDYYKQHGERGSKVDEVNTQWSTEAPYLFELFENIDHDRLATIRDSLLKFQTGYSDYLLSSTRQCESDMNTILSFRPESEIERFARDAANYNFQLVSAPQQQDASTPNNVNNNEKKEKRKSTLGNIGQRFTSSSTVLHHDLMNNEFSDSNNNASLKSKKSPGRLRSKVGSIFSRNKLKSKKSQTFSNKQYDTISESSHPETGSKASISRQSTGQSQPHPPFPQAQAYPQSQPQSQPNSSRTVSTATGYETVQQNSSYMQGGSSPTSPNMRGGMYQPNEPNYVSNMNNMPEVSRNENVNTMSMSQPPLQAQLSKALPPQPNSPPKQIPAPVNSSASSPAVETDARSFHIQAPVAPPSRKQTRQIPNPSGTPLNGIAEEQTQAPMTQPTDRPVSVLLSQNTSGMRTLDPQSTGTSTLMSGQSLFQHMGSTNTSFGLNASVAEVINATFKDGVLSDSHLIGEIALNYVKDPNSSTGLPIGLNLRIDNGKSFDKVILNNAFMEQVSPEEFKVNPQFIDSRTLGAIKYSVKHPNAPIVVHPVWKFEPHQASVVLTVKLSPTLPESVQRLVLHDFAVYVAIDGAETTNALSKPQGSFSKERKRITWKFSEPLVLDKNGSERLIARFVTSGLAHETEKGVIAKFSIQGSDTELATSNVPIALHSQESSEEDPFGGSWKLIQTNKTLTAGNYFGLSG